MSASEAPAFTAVAFQLAAALDAYEQDVEAMVTRRLDPELCQRVSGDMDTLRLYAASLPHLSVQWVELLIRHFELMHALWREHKGTSEEDDLAQLLDSHAWAAKRLREQTLRLLASSDESVA